jgi:tetratricopeptide (TPR) repeat protein
MTSIGFRQREPVDGDHSPHGARAPRRNVTQPKCVKCTLLASSSGFGAFARRAALAVLLCAGMAAHADPYEFEDTGARDPDFAAGKVAMEKKDWKEAVKRFHQTALREPDNADVQNFLGYGYRNLRELDLAFKHYKRAIELNPRHRGAHEYIGEAYLIVNDMPNAEKHLAALREICLLPCEELADLETAIKQYRAKPRP